MALLALTMPGGTPLSWVAALIVALGLIGLGVGTALRVRRRGPPAEAPAPESGRSSTEVSPRA